MNEPSNSSMRSLMLVSALTVIGPMPVSPLTAASHPYTAMVRYHGFSGGGESGTTTDLLEGAGVPAWRAADPRMATAATRMDVVAVFMCCVWLGEMGKKRTEVSMDGHGVTVQRT